MISDGPLSSGGVDMEVVDNSERRVASLKLRASYALMDGDRLMSASA